MALRAGVCHAAHMSETPTPDEDLELAAEDDEEVDEVRGGAAQPAGYDYKGNKKL